MIHQGRWKEFIREIPVKKGDFIQIDPGTVHAIKGGLMILETQQNSDITYRVYDYDRLSNGKPRELHVEKNKLNELYSCQYYKVFKIELDGKMEFEQEYPFLIMSVLEGDALLNGQRIKKGDHFILPNGYGKVELQGNLEIIASTI